MCGGGRRFGVDMHYEMTVISAQGYGPRVQMGWMDDKAAKEFLGEYPYAPVGTSISFYNMSVSSSGSGTSVSSREYILGANGWAPRPLLP